MAKKQKNEEIDDTIEIYAKVKLKANEYQKFKNGELHSDKGLRGDDGKISSIPDFEEVDDYDINNYGYGYDIFNDYEYDNYSYDTNNNYNDNSYDRDKDYKMSPAMEKLCDAVAEILVDATIKFGERIFGYIKPNITKIKEKKKNKKDKKIYKKRKYTQIDSHNNTLMSNVNILDYLSDELDIINTKYEDDCLNEETKRHFVNIFALSVQLAYEIKAVSELVTNKTIYNKYKVDVEKIIQNRTIEGVNNILTNDINMLDENYTNKLSAILGYSIIDNDSFTLINREKIEEKLLL